MEIHNKVNAKLISWLIYCMLIVSIISFVVLHLPNETMHKKSIIVCTRFPKVKIRGRRPALTLNYYLQWSNHKTINVFFYAGVNNLTRSIVSIANEWSNYCGMKFKIVRLEHEANVKVSFENKGYGSAIGIECTQEEYKLKPSMYLQGIDTLRNKEEFRRIILHEFGHALGIEHELKNPNARIPWVKSEVYRHYLEEYGWNAQRVDREIFTPLEPGDKPDNDFDTTSIMVYSVGPPLTEKNYSIPWPKDLSTKDKVDILTWYPK